jgi:2-polyprenyl-3-methyl-5-hydroxy-6-metoxy-1,4-benzoquinol methylase
MTIKMRQYRDYLLGKIFNFSYWSLNKVGLFFLFAPVFTQINKILHSKNTKKIKQKLREFDSNSKIAAPQVCNSLPNTGGVVFDEEFVKYKVASKKLEASKPSNIKDFEGVSVDDALSYKLEWKHYSFYPITEVIKEIAQKYLNKETYSLLELGCGAGSIFSFVRYNSCIEYLGLDANTIALNYSPNTKNYSNNFCPINLEQEINFNYQFDIIISFEVLEHLKKNCIPNIMRTIANHMGKKSIFLGTASTRKMDVHFTVEDKSWWLNEFEKVNLISHPKSKEITELMAANHPYNWNIATSILFAMIKSSD